MHPMTGGGDVNMKYRAAPSTVDEDGNHRVSELHFQLRKNVIYIFQVLLTTSGNLTRTIYNPEALAAAAAQKAAEKTGSGSEPTTPPSPAATAQKPALPQPPPMVHPKLLRKQQKMQVCFFIL